jgi:hypothetical protein
VRRDACGRRSSPETGETVARLRSMRSTVAGTVASQVELPALLVDVAEVRSMHASAGGTATTAPGGKAQRRSSRLGEAGGSDLMWLSSTAVQDEASPLEHGTRDMRPGQSEMKRKRARPWRCDSAQSRRKWGRGKRGGPGWVHHAEGGGGVLAMARTRARGLRHEPVRSDGGSPRTAAPGRAWGRQGKRERRARAGETDQWGRLTVGTS